MVSVSGLVISYPKTVRCCKPHPVLRSGMANPWSKQTLLWWQKCMMLITSQNVRQRPDLFLTNNKLFMTCSRQISKLQLSGNEVWIIIRKTWGTVPFTKAMVMIRKFKDFFPYRLFYTTHTWKLCDLKHQLFFISWTCEPAIWISSSWYNFPAWLHSLNMSANPACSRPVWNGLVEREHHCPMWCLILQKASLDNSTGSWPFRLPKEWRESMQVLLGSVLMPAKSYHKHDEYRDRN